MAVSLVPDNLSTVPIPMTPPEPTSSRRRPISPVMVGAGIVVIFATVSITLVVLGAFGTVIPLAARLTVVNLLVAAELLMLYLAHRQVVRQERDNIVAGLARIVAAQTASLHAAHHQTRAVLGIEVDAVRDQVKELGELRERQMAQLPQLLEAAITDALADRLLSRVQLSHPKQPSESAPIPLRVVPN